MSYYAVKKGRIPGVYRTWPEVQKQIVGFGHPIFKKFDNQEDANDFVKSYKQSSITAFFPKQDPQENERVLICFTDGSTLGNGQANAKGSFAVVWPYHHELNYAERVHPATNNICEYKGVIHAIIQSDLLDPDRNMTLIVYTDSLLLINSLTKWLPGWKKNNYKKSDGEIIANLDLVKTLEVLITQRNVSFRHVKAHTGGTDWESIYNDKVDQMARAVTSAR